tara:strand:+ start:3197 stop:5803 length:2607 start_codon:yes stop_codon:yes gene_type:complete
MANGQYQVGQRFKSPAGDTYEVIALNPDGTPAVREVTTRKDLDTGFLRTVGQGATFGFSDELRGVGRGLKGLLTEGGSFKEDYKSGREAEQSALQKYRDQAGGGMALLAEGIGGLATGVGGAALLRGGLAGLKAGVGAYRGGKGLLGASKAAQVAGTGAKAKRSAQLAKTGSGLGGQAFQAGKYGAMEGAVYGIGAADADEDTLKENLEERLKSGLIGGVGGGVVGGTIGGVMGLAPMVQKIKKGLTASRLGKGSVAGGTGSALDAAQEIGDLAIAKQVRDEVNQKAQSGGGLTFKELAEEWASKVNKNSRHYKKYLESEDSELFGGLMALTQKGIGRRSTLSPQFARTVDDVLGDTSGRRLLGTLNDDLQKTAVISSGASGGKGDPARFLKTNAEASADDTAKGLLKEIKDTAGAGRVGSRRATAESIEEEAKKLTNKEYESLYKMSDDEFSQVRKALRDDPEGRKVIEDLTNAYGPNAPLGGGLVKSQHKAMQLAYTQALNASPQDKALIARLKKGLETDFIFDEVTETVTRAKTTGAPGETVTMFGKVNPDGTVTPPSLGDLNIEQVDLMRRSLRDFADQNINSAGDTDRALGIEAKKMLARLDNVVDGAAPKYGKVRKDFGARKDATRAYGEAAKLKNQNQASISAVYDTLSDTPVTVGRTQDGAGRAINKSEKQMFRQGVLDDIADEVGDAADEVSKLQIIDKSFRKYFDRPGGVFAKDLSTADIDKLRKSLTKGHQNVKLASELDNVHAEGLYNKVVADKGALEATAFGYALAGQPGAAARTTIASGFYGPGIIDPVSNAFAKRLGRQMIPGLLDVADNIVKQEAKTIQGLAKRELLSAGTGGVGAGLLQATSDPERFRRRR